MAILKIKLMENNTILKYAQMPYNNESSFFLALVSICDELQVDIPIWTMSEERLFDKEGSVTIPLDINHKIVISN